jgi:hypothetical protein
MAAETVGAVPALRGRALGDAATEDGPVNAPPVHVRVVVVGRSVRGSSGSSRRPSCVARPAGGAVHPASAIRALPGSSRLRLTAGRRLRGRGGFGNARFRRSIRLRRSGNPSGACCLAGCRGEEEVREGEKQCDARRQFHPKTSGRGGVAGTTSRPLRAVRRSGRRAAAGRDGRPTYRRACPRRPGGVRLGDRRHAQHPQGGS